MKFSTRAEYGLRAILRIAKTKKRPYSLAKIAKIEGISLGYLEKLLAKLKKAGLVKSTKGMKGGYILNYSPTKIKISQVIQALEGTLAPFYCVDKRHGKISCPPGCLTQQVWLKLYQQINKTLEKITLANLIK